MESFPQHMQKGSKGPHITLLQAVLCGLGYGDNLMFSQYYDVITTEAVASFQKSCRLSTDGRLGPETRRALVDACDFNFEAACRVVPGTTVFVQPDGSEVAWTSPAGQVAKPMVQTAYSGSSGYSDDWDDDWE